MAAQGRYSRSPVAAAIDLSAIERSWRDRSVNETEWLVTRHRDERELKLNTTLTSVQFAELLVYRQSLRDWPQSTDFPKSEHRPPELSCSPSRFDKPRTVGLFHSSRPFSRKSQGFADVERLQMRQMQTTACPYGRVHRTPDQMFPLRNVESCEGHEPRTIACERHERGMFRYPAFDSIGEKSWNQ